MSVDVSAVIGEISWMQSKTNNAFVKTKQGPDKITLSLSPSTTTYNRIYAVSGTLAASASTTIDLQGVTDYLAQSLTLTSVIAIMLKATTTNMIYSPGATNGLNWFLGGTTPTVTVTAGGFFLFGAGVAGVVSGSAKTITITNASGSLSGSYELALIGGQ